MTKTVKIVSISLLSVVALVIVGISVTLGILFSSSKLTPIVRKEAAKYLKAETTLDHVELTFFSTFPRFGIQIDDLCLKNPMAGSPSDTLAYMKACTATVDLMALWKQHSLILHRFDLQDGFANIYIDKDGKANFDIVKSTGEESPQDTTSTTEAFLKKMDLQSIQVENFRTHYIDEQQRMEAMLDGLNLYVKGGWNAEPMASVIRFDAKEMQVALRDSVPMFVDLKKSHLNFNGDLSESMVNGTLELELPAVLFKMDQETFIADRSIQIDAPVCVNLNEQAITLKEATLKYADLALSLDGNAAMQPSGAITMDMNFDLSDWNLKNLLSYVPASYLTAMKDIDVDGLISMKGRVSGTYQDSVMPLVNTELNFTDGKLRYTGFPTFEDIQAQVAADIDLNQPENSNVEIKRFDLRSGKSRLGATGTVKDCMNAMLCDLDLKADVNLPDWRSLIPKDLKVKMAGEVNGTMHTQFSVADLSNRTLQKVKANGQMHLKGINCLYQDSMGVKIPEGTIAIVLPSPLRTSKMKESVAVNMTASKLLLNMVGTLQSELAGADVKMEVSNFMDAKKMPSVACQFKMNHLTADMDTLKVAIQKPEGQVNMVPSKANPENPAITCRYTSESILTQMGKELTAKTARVDVDADVNYDPKKKEILSQWNPTVHVNLHQGNVAMGDAMKMKIPQIKFEFTPNKMVIDQSQVIIDDSDFNLSGIITNINEYLENKGLLTANLDFVSNNTAIDQLMDLANGFGRTDSMEIAESKEANAQPVSPEDNPFMVPLGVDVRLNTKIKNATFGDNSVQNVGGVLNIKDGVMVLEQMGFTNKAANMQLTAIYRSPRKNHLFVGMDFHLLNIDIAELIHMIPDVDTIVPMLKSFDGKAQFHLAAETYLKSNYDLKFSTLRGAAAIEGQDLVVMDNSTFSTIAKWLRFNKKTRNQVDSLSVEMTVFRNEVDLYPFLVSMDKYKAVIAGRHNLDMNFDYHISVTDCPLPIRLGLEVKGNMDKLKYKLVPCKYANLYRPEKRNAVQTETVALKKLISDALKKSVKPIPTAEK